MKTTLVTGGGGFLGLAIVRQLIERGYRVRSYSRSSHPELARLGVESFAGDLVESNALAKAMNGCDIVYHVAAKAGIWGRYRDYFEPNVVGTRNVIDACRKMGTSKLVYTSTPSVIYPGGDLEGVDESLPYPAKFEAPYAETKALAEREVLAANCATLSTVALRPHLIWGPDDPHLIPRIVARAKAGRLKRIGDGKNKVDVIYVENAALGHVLAGETLSPSAPQAGKAYFLSQGEPVLLWDFIDRILEVHGVPPVKKRVPIGLAYAAGMTMEAIYRLLPFLGEPPMTRFVAHNLSTSHWFDITAARRDFGYRPVISIEEGLRLVGESVCK